MRNDKLIQELQRFPADYEICLSAYLMIDSDNMEGTHPSKEDNHIIEAYGSESDEYLEVINDSIIGIAINEKDKEIRFVIESSDEEALKIMEEEISPFAEELVNDASFNWRAILKLVEKDGRAFIGNMFELWGYGKDEAIQKLMEFQEVARKYGLDIEPDLDDASFVYVRKKKLDENDSIN